MLVVISPAKSLDFESATTIQTHSQPMALNKTQTLIKILKQKKPADLAALMKISDKLSQLNVDRYQAWQKQTHLENSKQAILAFQGDVYRGLDAKTLDHHGLKFAQKHLRILSGLYGMLKPLDLIQPYRLEMGTKLTNPKGENLYAFWGNAIAKAINAELREHSESVLVNLSSQEYFKAVDLKTLDFPVITPVFKDLSHGKYRVLGLFAKYARGLMSRYMIDHRIKKAADLKSFDCEGYYFNPSLSDDHQWVFTRDQR